MAMAMAMAMAASHPVFAPGASRLLHIKLGFYTVTTGGHTPKSSAITTSVTSSCAMFMIESDEGRPANASYVMKRAAVRPAQRMTVVKKAEPR
jgi:hypothetical protein